MNKKLILHTLGVVLNFEAAALILPLITSLIYKDNQATTFLICIALCLVFGIPLTLRKVENKNMFAKEGFIIVALSWILMSIFGAIPFIISGSIPNFIDAVFETASGFTTTGASILTDVEKLSKSMIMWRSFTHWIGGMGVLVFLVAILPLSGSSNLHLMRAESPGPSVSKLVPGVKTTAKILYGIYTIMTIIEVIFLIFGGMSVFEALTLSFGTAGTGGFGIVNSSVAGYSSYCQNVITVFMILFGVNFSLYYLILIGNIKEALRSTELRAYFLIILISISIICANCYYLFDSFGETLKHAAFQVGSVITTTGYSTTDFDKWPELSKTILLLLMFVGATAGSTGGGIKVSRVLILLKTISKELRIAIHPKRAYKIKMDGRLIEHETVRAVNVFMISYIILFAFSLLIISIDNFSFSTNFSAVTATINNIGPGFDKVGPTMNFSIYSPISKIVLTFCMLAGRLELFPLLVLFSPHTWKK